MSRFAPTSAEMVKFAREHGIHQNDAHRILTVNNMQEVMNRAAPNPQLHHDVLREILSLMGQRR